MGYVPPPPPPDPNNQHDDGATIRPERGLPQAIRRTGTSTPYAPGVSERRFTTLAGDPILYPPAPPVATHRFDTLAEVNAAFPCLDVRIAAAERRATMPAARSRTEGPPEVAARVAVAAAQAVARPTETLWPDLHEDRAIINRQPEGGELLDISTGAR